MFCFVNPVALSGLLKAPQSNSDCQKLCQYLGLALHRNIIAFGVGKKNEEVEQNISEKCFDTDKTISAPDSKEKIEEDCPISVGEERKTEKEFEENAEKSGKSEEIGKEGSKRVVKRRIIRKQKQQKAIDTDTKIVKSIKINPTFKFEFTCFTAALPTVTKISDTWVMRKKEELFKRSVKEWRLYDDEDLRRRRFLKQMQ